LTIPLARMGLDMTGVDLMDSFIRRARRRAKRGGVAVDFRRGDMREIEFDMAFDAVINWFSSFGYFSDAVNLAVCRRMFRALKPGGRLLIECLNKSWFLTHFEPHLTMEVHGVGIDIRTRFDARTQRAEATWVFRRGAATERRRISLRMFNGTDLRTLLRRAGFREIELIGRVPRRFLPRDRPSLGRLTRHSRRVLAIGRRPAKRSRKR
jgi:SAM-dependent methyltransferase